MEEIKMKIAAEVDSEFVISWKNLGDNNPDDVESFFYYYVIFNYLYQLNYGYLHPQDNELKGRVDDKNKRIYERDLIKDYIYLNYNILRSYDFQPSFINIPSEFYKKADGRTNKKLIKCYNDKTNDYCFYDFIYTIRCNLFHGAKRMYVLRDDQLIKAGSILLKHMVECSMKACGINEKTN